MGAYDDVNMEGEISDTAMAEDSSTQDNEDSQIGGVQPVQQTTQQTQASPASQEATQQPQSVWNGQEWVLKYRGQPYQPKSRDELVNLAQKGFSYTQEMERINTERRQYNDHVKQMQTQYGHYDEFDKLLKNNPALAERIMQVAQEYQGQRGPGAASGGDQRVSELTQRLQQLESQNSERINSEMDRKLLDTITTIKKQYPNHDWEYDDGTGNMERKLLQFAYDNGITNLDYAYRAMMWDTNGATAKADALKQATATKQQATRAGVIQKTTTAGTAPARPGYKYGDTYGDLARKMADEIKT